MGATLRSAVRPQPLGDTARFASRARDLRRGPRRGAWPIGERRLTGTSGAPATRLGQLHARGPFRQLSARGPNRARPAALDWRPAQVKTGFAHLNSKKARGD